MPDATPLDTLADALAGRLLEALPAGQPHGRESLARLPAPVAHLLTAALDRRVAREAAPPQSPWLDAESAAMVDATRRWRDAVRAAARYPAEAWAPALHDACRLALRHLVDPADATGAFCFAGERGELPSSTVRARLSAFGPYPYLREIVEEYVGRKGLTHLDRAALEGLVRRIDRRMAAGYGVAEWTALLDGLYALAGVVPGQEGRVPTALLRRFFAVRGADGIAESLPARPALTTAEVRAALTAALSPAPAPPAVRDLLVDPRDAAAATAAFAPRSAEPPFLGAPTPAPTPEPEPVPEPEPIAETPPADAYAPGEDTPDAGLLEPDDPGDDLAEAALDPEPEPETEPEPDEDLEPEDLEPDDLEETEPDPLTDDAETDDAPWESEADESDELEGYTLIDETDGPADGDVDAPHTPAPDETETDDEDGWE
ncbi:MAG TPA: hypothetical protein VK610_02060, partial [Rhodothermales bacterium]|nr:hypothetical protein [Rhodothermales bacterium]